MRKSCRRAIGFLFYDQVRVLEIYSALNLLAWAAVLGGDPAFFGHAAYAGFDALAADVWARVFGAAAIVQIAAMLIRWSMQAEARFVAMAFAAGAWSVIAHNFWQAGAATTADMTYGLLAVICAISGVWLAWQTTSYQS